MANTNLKNQLAAKADGQVAANKKKPSTIKEWIQTMEPEIKKALPSVITPERFTRMALTAISVNPKLAECTPKSFMGSLMNAAQLGLEPNTPLGQAYLIPFKNKGVMEVQFQIGYKGLIDLAHRSGEFTNIYAKEVYENDVFEYTFGLEPTLIHKPATKAKGNIIAYYAVFKLVNSGFGFDVMSREDIMDHAKKYSQSFNSKYSPWTNNFDEMSKKTVLKKVLKYAPIKVEFVKQVAEDSTIKNEIAEDMSEIQSENVFVDAEYEIEDDKDQDPTENKQVDLAGTPFDKKDK